MYRPKTGKFRAVYNCMMEYIHQHHDDGCAVSYELLQNKAHEVACILTISDSQFKVSIGWVIYFIRKHKLRL